MLDFQISQLYRDVFKTKHSHAPLAYQLESVKTVTTHKYDLPGGDGTEDAVSDVRLTSFLTRIKQV